MSTPEERAQRAEYMRGWTRQNAERIAPQRADRYRSRADAERRVRRERYVDNESYRQAAIARAKQRYHAMTPEQREAERRRKSAYKRAHPEKAREASHRRRARLHAAVIEPFSELAIFERDRWLCGICEQIVDPIDPDRWMRASLDHIIPVVDGGPHTAANVRLAHRRCNYRRGRRAA